MREIGLKELGIIEALENDITKLKVKAKQLTRLRSDYKLQKAKLQKERAKVAKLEQYLRDRQFLNYLKIDPIFGTK